MKTFLITLLLAGMLAGVFGGCSALPGAPAEPEAEPNGAGDEDLHSAVANAERIDFYGSDGSLLRTLETAEEMDVFFDALDLADWDWDITEQGAVQPNAELTVVFSKKPHATVLGGEPAEGEREELIRLTLYQDSSLADLQLSLFTFQVALPEAAITALREAATPNAA